MKVIIAWKQYVLTVKEVQEDVLATQLPLLAKKPILFLRKTASHVLITAKGAVILNNLRQHSVVSVYVYII